MGKKFYKTEVFEYGDSKIRKAGDIIVEKRLLGVREIVSGVEMDCIHDLLPFNIAEADIARTGHYIYVRRSQLNNDSVATQADIISYVDGYENNPFKKIADEIITKEQRQKAMTKVSKVKRG